MTAQPLRDHSDRPASIVFTINSACCSFVRWRRECCADDKRRGILDLRRGPHARELIRHDKDAGELPAGKIDHLARVIGRWNLDAETRQCFQAIASVEDEVRLRFAGPSGLATAPRAAASRAP